MAIEALAGSALLGRTLDELAALSVDHGFPQYCGAQLAQWLYRHRATDVGMMSNLSKRMRSVLAEGYQVGRMSATQRLVSVDGTVKYLFPVGQGRSVESAVIPDRQRRTLCVSSQSGCRMGCQFCATGQGAWGGNLTAGQIVNQLLSVEEAEQVSNIVFMGMGEPLDNYDSVLRAVEVMTSSWGLAMSPRRITVSTIGVRGVLLRLLRECECHVAISLHSPFELEREQLLPGTRGYAIRDLLSDLRSISWGGQRRLSFEYVVLRGVNDTPAHVRALARLLAGVPCLVNLIGYHPHPLSAFARPEVGALDSMRDALNMRGIVCTVRTSKGMDISAACGLLSRSRGV